MHKKSKINLIFWHAKFDILGFLAQIWHSVIQAPSEAVLLIRAGQFDKKVKLLAPQIFFFFFFWNFVYSISTATH